MLNLIPTDTELFAAVKLDDQKAFNLLYDRYWKLVYKRAFSYIKDTEVCKEMVNDIFYNIWKTRHEREITLFQNYLTVAARYKVYSYLRGNRSSSLIYVENYEEIDAIFCEDNIGDQNIRSKELIDDMTIVLKDLPKRCQEIFVLSRKHHLSNMEIADRLSVSKRTVDNQISLAVKYLRARLSKYIIFMIILRLFF